MPKDKRKGGPPWPGGPPLPYCAAASARYFDELLPELPLEPVLPLLEPDPMLPLLLGLLGLVVLLGLLLELEPPDDELPLELAPDLLKYASHSERDTWPSLFLSTVVKLGVSADAPELLLPMPELPPLDAPLEELGEELDGDELDELPPLEELPLALGEDELGEDDELPVALGEDEDLSLLEDELCAIDTLASANSAAAVAVVISFNFIWSFLLQESGGERTAPLGHATPVPTASRAAGL